MSTHPTLGIPGSKPRLKAESNGSPSNKAEIAKLSEEYLHARNEQMRAKSAVAQMELARRMGELIPRKVVFDTLAHYMVVFRQRALLLHRMIAQRLVTLNLIDDANSHAVSEVIGKEVRSLLNELGHLPQKATDPNWMAQLEKDELGLESDEREHRQTPNDHRREQARFEKRRAQKAATMRKLREAG